MAASSSSSDAPPCAALAASAAMSLWLPLISRIGADRETPEFGDLWQAIRDYEARDKARTEIWSHHFANHVAGQ